MQGFNSVRVLKLGLKLRGFGVVGVAKNLEF